MRKRQGALWGITSFFNPAGYGRRLANYRRFRAALPIPLATIELGFDGRWELEANDADFYLRVADGDVLWQKERLLNVLLERLPPQCEYVAWIDGDVLLQDAQWPLRTIEQLALVPLVQLFSTLRYLERDGEPRATNMRVASVTATILAGHSPATAIGRTTDRTGGAPAAGMAWAARRVLLQRHRFYDGCVIGGGDTALACAAYGVPDIVMGLHRMNAGQRERYVRWAAAFHGEVQGRVGALAGEIHHLWHGELVDRRAGLRHADIEPHSFDPATDLRLGTDGAWRWASAKPALHTLLRDYFHHRKEDGR